MTDDERIEALKQQEAALIFPRFDEATVYDVGSALRAEALARQAAIVIDIRSGTRRLYFTALPGSAPDNEDWARRKGNVTLRCHASSLRVGLALAREGRQPWPDGALETSEYAAHGGGFPIRVQGTGVVATVGVSGLPSREDHVLIVTVLARHLGLTNFPATP